MRPKARKARWEGHSSLMVKDFSAIMKAGTWKASADTPVCGEGSTVEHTAPFSSFLTRLCSAEWGQVRSVADLGCGDLTFMSSVDIGDVRYRGFDCARGHIKVRLGTSCLPPLSRRADCRVQLNDTGGRP